MGGARIGATKLLCRDNSYGTLPDMKNHTFGAALARIREEQGFTSAHAFYRSREGRRNLGLSFANYLNIEKGRSLPQSRRVRPILAALGLSESSPQARELANAYLVSLLGSDDLLVMAGGGRSAAPGRSLAEEAAHQAISQRAVQLSIDQWNVMAQSRAAYDCHIFLVNTPGWVALEELRKVTGLAAPALKKTLAALASAGLVEVSGPRVRSPLARKALKSPGPLAAVATLQAALYNHRKAWTEDHAKLVHLSHLTVRLPKANVDRYAHQLAEAVQLSAVYGDVERTADTAVYLVEGRIYSVFP